MNRKFKKIASYLFPEAQHKMLDTAGMSTIVQMMSLLWK